MTPDARGHDIRMLLDAVCNIVVHRNDLMHARSSPAGSDSSSHLRSEPAHEASVLGALPAETHHCGFQFTALQYPLGKHRPDLVICDDIEDMASVRNKESRDKTYSWLKGDVFPIGDDKTKIVIVGNLLHEDSTLMRIREEIKEHVSSNRINKKK